MSDAPDAPLQSQANLAMLVAEDERIHFLPKLFGRRHFLFGEAYVYGFMTRLSPDYHGGLWDFLEHSGRPLYLAPTSAPRYRIICETNGYEGEVTAQAAGIIATLFALSHLSFDHPSDRLVEGYERLRIYADGHAEAAKIYGATD